ncbi:MAG TPA: hypothetical protein VMB91_13195 [Solirubrobacteraceae bacterium]|nr:hypothetical protein [Solirubrobacteraceae bacterium]
MLAVRPWWLPIGLLPVLLLLAPPASASVTVEGPAGDAMIPRLQQWADTDAMPTGQGVIQIVPENCLQMEAEACTYWSQAPRFVMYMPNLEYLWGEPGHSEAELEGTYLNFYHELGHVLDFGLARHGYRLAWFQIMRYRKPAARGEVGEMVNTRDARAWFSAVDAHGRSVIPDEQFAQAYDYCAAGMGYPEMQATMRGVYWGFSYTPSARQYREACQLISGL